MSLEREIEDLLAVDHSPEFVAKVRQRVAVEPPAAAGWFSWKQVPIGAGVAAVTMAALLWPAGDTVRVPPAVESTHSVARVAPRTIAPAPAPTVAPSRPRTIAPLPVPVRRIEPEILLSVDEMRAFQDLLRRFRQGNIPEMTVTSADAEVTERLGPPSIEISPVTVPPMTQLTQPEGERQ